MPLPAAGPYCRLQQDHRGPAQVCRPWNDGGYTVAAASPGPGWSGNRAEAATVQRRRLTPLACG
jgi:hypothetical protein